jgi:hypothetical protein
MSRQYRPIPLSLVSAIFLGVLASLYLLVFKKRRAKPSSSPAISTHTVEQPAEALKYWTVEKMRNAKPMDLPNVTDLGGGKQQGRRPD